MNSSIWLANNSSTSVYLSLVISEDQLLDRSVDTTLTPLNEISEKSCGQALSSQTHATVKLPGSLDALLYIVIVLMFYAFSIVVLMVKYIRREREEASLRNYYHEFVSREKFRSAQYKNSQFMKRTLGIGGGIEEVGRGITDECVNKKIPSTSMKKTKSVAKTIIKNGSTFSKYLLEGIDGDEKKIKESFTFLSAKNQFCKRGFFGKKFCNKQLCSKCVTEGAPTIDWGDDKCETGVTSKDIVEIKMYKDVLGRRAYLNEGLNCSEHKSSFSLERDNVLFFPIIECESEKDSDEVLKPFGAMPLVIPQTWENTENVSIAEYKYEEQAIISSCSLEVSELLANMPPLGAFSNSNDMDTLDGLSNLDSEAESQSLLNYSTSIRGTSNMFLNCEESPRAIVAITDDCLQFRNSKMNDKQCPLYDGTHKDLSDLLSERTSLLSCTLSIANEVDEDDGVTNHSSSKHYNKGFSKSNGNCKIKEEFAIASGKLKEELNLNAKSILNSMSKSNNGDTTSIINTVSKSINADSKSILNSVSKSINADSKSILNSVSKSINGDEEEMMRLLTNITMITEESGLFKNLKYFLRSFSKHEHIDCPHEKIDLLPKETYFGPGSPIRVFSSAVTPSKNTPASKTYDFSDMNYLDNDLLNMEDSEKHGNRWGYTNDEDDDIYSDGGRSSSFGDYCMGDATDSQVIDLSGPLIRRQLDSETRNGLSQAFIGLDESWQKDDQLIKKTNPMLAGYGAARKETKV